MSNLAPNLQALLLAIFMIFKHIIILTRIIQSIFSCILLKLMYFTGFLYQISQISPFTHNVNMTTITLSRWRRNIRTVVFVQKCHCVSKTSRCFNRKKSMVLIWFYFILSYYFIFVCFCMVAYTSTQWILSFVFIYIYHYRNYYPWINNLSNGCNVDCRARDLKINCYLVVAVVNQ